MKVLITGHEGFIGRHFARRLADHDPLGIDIKSTHNAGIKKSRTMKDVRHFFDTSTDSFDLVIHCAAVVGGRTMIEGSPLTLAAEDLSIDAMMWRWALRTRPKHLVYFSSSAAYPTILQGGIPRKLIETDISLNHIDNPDQSYGWVKLTGEMMAQEAVAEGIITHVFRPFSGYGADQDLAYPFPSFVDRARRQESPFQVWGDGTQVRDWIHVDDIVGAVMKAYEENFLGPVNLCTGVATEFNDLAEMMMKAAGYSAPIVHHLDAPRGVSYRVGDPGLMQTFYTPKISLEEGITRCLKA